jgi:6-phosphofructokinase
MKNLLVGQSGGPTAVINSSLYGVINEFLQLKDDSARAYGMLHGIEGFLNGDIVDLEKEFEEQSLELLKNTPGAYLGSCRYKLPGDLEDPVYEVLFQKLEALDIGYFLYIGGNDSMDTVSKLSRYAKKRQNPIRIIGIPKTVDNDLVLTDHTPGFGSAAKYVASTVREIGIDVSVYDTESVTIVEIMGRHAGWLTAASILARKFENDNPLLIYLPETAFDENEFIMKLEAAFSHTKNVVVCISEGIQDINGKFICEYASEVGTDNFGHKKLAGAARYLETLVSSRLNKKVRSIELSLVQRCSSIVQSLADVNEAVNAGSFGIKGAINGETGSMVACKRISNEPYVLSYEMVDVNLVCNEEKTIPLSWITKDGTDLSEEFIAYVKPLIQGETITPVKDGLPLFAYRKK